MYESVNRILWEIIQVLKAQNWLLRKPFPQANIERRNICVFFYIPEKWAIKTKSPTKLEKT